ncbi:hypothetical protein HMPREF9120_00278 [Neisseria sp. oral taxon 020 str. F0370]|nr:hypothetical protein HMPREF9120_00278 [Neisseria sp. oral taxon 020 str. F0370]
MSFRLKAADYSVCLSETITCLLVLKVFVKLLFRKKKTGRLKSVLGMGLTLSDGLLQR